MVESELWQIPGPLVQAEIQAASGQEEEREGQKGQRDSQKGEGGAKGKMGLFFSLFPVLRIRDVYPGFEFFPSRIRIKELDYFSPKIVSKLSEI
jgi:hypothetical protein